MCSAAMAAESKWSIDKPMESIPAAPLTQNRVQVAAERKIKVGKLQLLTILVAVHPIPAYEEKWVAFGKSVARRADKRGDSRRLGQASRKDSRTNQTKPARPTTTEYQNKRLSKSERANQQALSNSN